MTRHFKTTEDLEESKSDEVWIGFDQKINIYEITIAIVIVLIVIFLILKIKRLCRKL